MPALRQFYDHVENAPLRSLGIRGGLLALVMETVLQARFFEDLVETLFAPIAEHLHIAFERMREVRGLGADAGDLILEHGVLLARLGIGLLDLSAKILQVFAQWIED